MSSPWELLIGWLPAVGGVLGLAWLVYMGLMLYFHRRRDKELHELRIAVARIEGLLLGGRRR